MKKMTLTLAALISLSTLSYQGPTKVAYTALTAYNKECRQELNNDNVEETFSNDQGDYLVTFTNGGSVELKKAEQNNYDVVYVECAF